MNTLVLQAEVVNIDPLRLTPAGIPLLSIVLSHVSEQVEAGMARKVSCEVQAVLLGQNAQLHFVVGQIIIATGFLAKRSFKSTQLVMHINHIEYLS